MRLELKPSRRAASIKACHSPQQLPIRQLRLGFRALAYRHLHTRLAPAQDHATKSRMIGKQIKPPPNTLTPALTHTASFHLDGEGEDEIMARAPASCF
ncbi:hypothetical protein MHYP_G00125280 [Metynnis hypsauchen]